MGVKGERSEIDERVLILLQTKIIFEKNMKKKKYMKIKNKIGK